MSGAKDAIPPDAVALADYEALARERLDDNAWAYLSGGAADEITLRANRSAWDDIRLLPRVLQPLSGGHTRVELLGRTLAHPVLLGPVAYQRLAHPLGEIASAVAASAQGAGLVLSAQSSVLLEAVAGAVRDDASRGPLWFQLYWQRDRGFTRALVERAEAAGFEAIVLTVDAPVHGARDRERRAGFRLPPGVSAVNLASAPAAGAHPTADSPARPPKRPLAPGQSALFDDLLLSALTWADVEWLRSATRLPLLIKGVLHEADARQAAALGAAGVIVSNHGGRTLDTAVSTAWALPRIVDALAEQAAAAGAEAVPVLVDGGIRRGTDVLKAIALGARAVLLGRPYVHALAVAGAHGVAHSLKLLRDEFEIALALTGCATPGALSRAVLVHRSD
ncbi:MAG: 2-hydroxy-acid oxidase [Methylibium sp. NZG]|nr:MAG: 2-hydroxy-acid oxidase [Methylibium sp. NZG]